MVVVAGIYDHVESVLEALEVPHELVQPHELDRLALRPEQLLIVNCPGQVSPAAVTRIRAFVEAGGSLFTTDWALKHVVEPAFPGVLAFSRRRRRDDVVRIEVKDRDNIYLQGVLDGQDDPQWWLEGSSYPISILDEERVQVLITSRELGEKYGEAPVAVWFRWGEGDVFHMISHYYLQRTELRTERHESAAAGYFAEKGVAMTPAHGAGHRRPQPRRRRVGQAVGGVHGQRHHRQEAPAAPPGAGHGHLTTASGGSASPAAGTSSGNSTSISVRRSAMRGRSSLVRLFARARRRARRAHRARAARPARAGTGGRSRTDVSTVNSAASRARVTPTYTTRRSSSTCGGSQRETSQS